ncbi:MAG: hypothetical protein HN750_15885, partial [Gemmatimonadales bacterium]|nr:hypothetical protein [Gemmatimonadales bacterium]
ELLPRLAILLGWIWFGARGLRRRDGRRELATQACLSIPTVLLAWSLVDSASLLPADLTPWGSLAAVAPKVMIPATLVLVGLCGVAALRHHEVGMIGDADGARPPARYGRFLLGSLIGWALLWSGAGTLSDSRFRALEQTPSGWQRVEFPAGGVLVESQTGRWAALWPSPDGRPVGLVGVGVTLEGFSNGSAVVDLGRLVQVQLSPRPGLVYRVERYKGVTGEWALAEEWKAELERLKSGDIPECYEDFLVRRRR